MKQNYKSKIFNRGFLEGDEFNSFKTDIFLLNEIDSIRWESLFEYFKKIIISETEKEKNSIIKEILSLGLLTEYSEIYAAQRTILYFLKKFSNEETKEDTAEKVIHDIELDVEKKNLDSIKSLLEIIKKEAKWYESYKLQESYDSGLLPFLKGVGTTVELRGVFNRELEYGERVENYIEDVEINKENSIVPTITVALTLDSGDPNRFFFQLSKDRTNWLIEELKASLHKVKLLEENYKDKS